MKTTINKHVNNVLLPVEQIIRRAKPRLIAFSTMLLCAASPQYVYADIPEAQVFSNSPELSDAVLAETRGKFVSSGQIMNFGVQMVTEWITSTGEVINASGALAINLSQGQPTVRFEPVISVYQLQGYSVNPTQDNNIVSGSQGLENVSGVVQSIQVAGNANGIGNTIGISVKKYREDNTAAVGHAAANLNVTTPSGNTASVALGNNGFTVAVDVMNQGQAQQAIRSLSQGNGQVMQSVALGGSLNQIRNRINLDIQTQMDHSATKINQQQLLMSLRQMAPAMNF